MLFRDISREREASARIELLSHYDTLTRLPNRTRLREEIEAVLAAQDDYGFVANGRFKGGHITRHYGRPDEGVEAVQLEISQRCYMDEATFEWDAARAARLQPLLRGLLSAALHP